MIHAVSHDKKETCMNKSIYTTETAEIEVNRRRMLTRKINAMRSKGKPLTVQELRERLNDLYQWCEEHDVIPSIELSSAACGVTNRTFERWCNGLHCSSAWKEECVKARQLVISALEQATIDGDVSAPVGIFLLKAHGYSDTRGLEEQALLQRTESDVTGSYISPVAMLEKYSDNNTPMLTSAPESLSEQKTRSLDRNMRQPSELLDIIYAESDDDEPFQ